LADVENTRTVRGQIALPSIGLPTKAAQVIVQVEDISRADAPSTVVGEERLRDVRLGSETVLPFAVRLPAGLVDERHSYSVRVHIDVSGSGNVSAGDLLSTQTYPVLTRGYGDEVRIQVKPVMPARRPR